MPDTDLAPAPAPELAPARAYMPKASCEDWTTPQEIADVVRRIFDGRIDLDPASNPHSIVGAEREVWLPKWADQELAAGGPNAVLSSRIVVGDGLKIPWVGNVYTNPPYGRGLDDFMHQARRAGLHHTDGEASVIMLAPSKTSRQCWQQTVPSARAVCFIYGRLEYSLPDGTKTNAPFSSALILWTRDAELVHRFAYYLDDKHGHVMFTR
jgi:hypothetical protein